MSACKLCGWLCNRIDRDGSGKAWFWDRVTSWERAHSNQWELWCAEPETSRELVERARTTLEIDPEAGFTMLLEAVEAGSFWAMELAGWHYETGTAVERDIAEAQAYYYRAACAGSWMATLDYARALEKVGHAEHWNQVLEDGVANGFIPAAFWLAWYRYKRAPTRKTSAEIRPLLETAADAGHPAAKGLLARLLVTGKFGIRGIPRGLRLIRELISASPTGTGEAQQLTHPAAA